MLQYLGKTKVRVKFNFLYEDQSFLEADATIFFVTIAKHAQSTQSSKFSISLKNFKKEGRHEVDFLDADKQNFLQIDAINIGEYGQSYPEY